MDSLPTPGFLGSLAVQLVKNPPPMWETWVGSFGWEDPLEKGKAPHSRILAWRIPWTGHHVPARGARCRLWGSVSVPRAVREAALPV